MKTMEIVPDVGERYLLDISGHRLAVDQPVEDGGADTAPTPTELFVAGLAACIAFYAGRYLTRHDVPRDGLRVAVDWQMADARPARVGAVSIRITPPAALPADRVAA